MDLVGGDLCEARHINGPQGTYKGYKLEPTEVPELSREFGVNPRLVEHQLDNHNLGAVSA